MSRTKNLIIVYSVVILLMIYTMYNVNRTFTLDVEDRFTVTYLPNVTGISVYEPGEYNNVMKCNLTTVNKIISNMISEDYFYIVQDNSKGYIMDIVLTNDSEVYRIMYNRRTRDYMCVSKPFLKNYVPGTYIHE